MAVAQPVALAAATDAARAKVRDLADGATESRAALDERVSLALERGQRFFEQRTQLNHARQIFFRADLRLDAAAREHGFLQIVCHGVSASLRTGIRDVADEFYGLAEEEKRLVEPATRPVLEALDERVGMREVVGDDGKVRPLGVKVGDKVLFGKYSGQSVKVEGEELLVMREEDIMAVVE